MTYTEEVAIKKKQDEDCFIKTVTNLVEASKELEKFPDLYITDPITGDKSTINPFELKMAIVPLIHMSNRIKINRLQEKTNEI